MGAYHSADARPTASPVAKRSEVDRSMPGYDPKRLVAASYDRIADAYLRRIAVTRASERERYTRRLFARVAPGSRVLDLGCGAGVPTTRRLAKRYLVTGVDVSPEQIRRAKGNVPGATFLTSDMTACSFGAGTFAAVVAFYSIIHVPRNDQKALLGAIWSWLAPGGYFVGTLGARDTPGDLEPDWLGAPMYWSAFGPDANRQMVVDVGFSPVSLRLETADEEDVPVTFLWVVARKGDRPKTAGAPSARPAGQDTAPLAGGRPPAR